MNRKTYLTNEIEAAGYKAKYDSQIKRLLSDRYILAWIARYTVRELKGYDIEDVLSFIEGEPMVECICVYPGKKEAITGLPTNDAVPNEGEVTYDIKFYILIPERESIKLIINIEGQKEYHLPYDPVTRGVFYCSRMLSAQLGDEFTAANYDDLKKVYSIWIFMDTPKYIENTITEYKLHKNDIYGIFAGKARYDLMSVVTICLGNDRTTGGTELHSMLRTLLSAAIAPADKIRILETEYRIPASRESKEVMNSMCNLSDLIEERGIKRGLEQGIEQGLELGIEQGLEQGIGICIEMCRELNIPEEEIMRKLEEKYHLSPEKSREYMENNHRTEA